MIMLADILQISGYVIGSFLTGYAASFIFYVLRRTAWMTTS